MITRTAPDSWQSLQAQVGQILTECGFSVEIEKKIPSARGKVELDVYAEENVQGRKYLIACECKYWSAKIPQTVIHGFRTVVQDIGANIGFIISKEGFQSGAMRASDLTNLKLVTWQEFQDQFEESWFEAFFTNQIHEKLSGLMTYSEPLLPAWFASMSDDDKAAYLDLKDRYDDFGMLAQSLGPYMRVLTKGPIPKLPLRATVSDRSLLNVPDDILDETAYRELLIASIAHGENALNEYRALRSKYM